MPALRLLRVYLLLLLLSLNAALVHEAIAFEVDVFEFVKVGGSVLHAGIKA